jgi:hypothetical protein
VKIVSTLLMGHDPKYYNLCDRGRWSQRIFAIFHSFAKSTTDLRWPLLKMRINFKNQPTLLYTAGAVPNLKNRPWYLCSASRRPAWPIRKVRYFD